MHSRFKQITFNVAALAALAASQTTGVWTNVTPAGPAANIQLNGAYGTETVATDPNKPSDLYANFNEYGIYKSTDYGATWNGPINTGTNGSNITGDGNFTIASGGVGNPPTLYGGFIHNSAGFWRSTDGGVNWQTVNIIPAGSRQDVYQPDVDPNDPKHIVLCGHEYTGIFESSDGGASWKNVSFDPGMNSAGGTGYCFFINTGDPVTTAKTFLWIDQNSTGTWRSTNDGADWTKVDNNCHVHGDCQIYQPGNGVVYMAGSNSVLGQGVLRSMDYGKTWAHVGSGNRENCVFGTPNHVYAMDGGACVPCSNGSNFGFASQPGISGWTYPTTPSGMIGGGISQAAVTFDGTHYIIVASMWSAGLWRYVEAASASSVAAKGASVVKSGIVQRSCLLLTNAGVSLLSTGNKVFDVKGRNIRAR